MKRVSNVIRGILTGILLFQIYIETGIFTAIALALIALEIELNNRKAK